MNSNNNLNLNLLVPHTRFQRLRQADADSSVAPSAAQDSGEFPIGHDLLLEGDCDSKVVD